MVYNPDLAEIDLSAPGNPAGSADPLRGPGNGRPARKPKGGA
jgi:hypothetical protein